MLGGDDWATRCRRPRRRLQGGNLSEDSLESAVDDVKEATETLADDLEDAGKPDTEDGQQAKDLVDQLADEIDEGVRDDGRRGGRRPGRSGIVTAITQITSTLATMSSEVGGIVDQLEQLDPGTELEDAFENADECASLRSGG